MSERDEQTEEIMQYAVAFGLPPASARLLQLFMHEPYVTRNMVEDVHQIATETKVAVMRLRQQLSKHKVRIHSRYGVGYVLEPKTRERVRELVQRYENVE